MDTEEYMKTYIGKRIIWENEEVEIVSILTCYDGDFYYYKKPDGTIPRINANTHEGFKFQELLRAAQA